MGRRTILTLLAGLIFILAVFGCGGSSGSGPLASGGIGGSGRVNTSAGVVTAVGSITVNGVKFETDSASVTKESGGFGGALARGMVVEVRGTINADKTSGSAQTVDILVAVRGEIEAISGSQLTIAGQTVVVDDQTVFDDASVSPPSVLGLSIADLVEVNGLISADGMIRATRIERINALPSPDEVTTSGFVAQLTASTFKIADLAVDYQTASLIGFDSPLAAGDYVQVKGSLAAGGLLTAVSVEKNRAALSDDDELELEGYITSSADPSFALVSALGQIPFKIDAGTEFEGGTVADLVVGARVEVEGVVVNGVLMVTEISLSQQFQMENVAVQSADAASATVALAQLSNITIKADALTRFEDQRSQPADDVTFPSILESLNSNDLLEIRGRRVGNTNTVLASRIRIDDFEQSAEVTLSGPVDAGSVVADTSFEILGITIVPIGSTEFEGASDRQDFFNRLEDTQIIEAEGMLTGDNQMEAEKLSLED